MGGSIANGYDRVAKWLSGPVPEGLMLLFVRIVLAGIFWRSGRLKIAEGTWFQLNETALDLFHTEYAAVPLPPDFAAMLATGAEHLFPALLVLGLLTRLSAMALLVMTMVIQIFVYPEAWWPVHALWVALALVLTVRGGGFLALDTLVSRGTRP